MRLDNVSTPCGSAWRSDGKFREPSGDLETDVEKILDEASALLYEHDDYIVTYGALAMSFKDLGLALSGWSLDMSWHEKAQDEQQKAALL